MRSLYFLSVVIIYALFISAKPTDLLNARGKITMLRTHDVGTKYGPPSDQIDVEAVIQLDTKPGMSFGFQLRNDNQRIAREGMLDLIRDAFRNNWIISIDYSITPPKKNGVIIRVWVEKIPNTVITPPNTN